MGSLSATAESIQFGKYSLVARLATGGMAEIFLARLQGVAGFEKLVCIKRILPHLARDKQFVAMFLDEARIAARISHPNVCQVFELGELEGSYYIAMEYLEGVPLGCFRRHDPAYPPPDPRLIAGIAVQACEALHHAHQLKNTSGGGLEVVHRDVSPQNLFVTVDGVVKVLDFGIAKIQDASVKTGTGAIKGTYAYMAPEQLRGERVDRRADVFALGIVMWETLVGRHLFQRDTDFLTFQAITSEAIADVAALRPDVPVALSEVVRTALSRDREARFPTARLLGDAIAAAVPPASGSAISEHVARAFPVELGAQAELLRVARDGGTFDLDVERGPTSARPQLTEALTTPISQQRHHLVQRSGPGSVPTALPMAATMIAPITGAIRAWTGSTTGAPAAASGWRWRPLVIAAVALLVGGVGAYVYARVAPSAGPSAGSSAGPRPAAPGPDAVAAMTPRPVDAVPKAADAAPAAPLIDQRRASPPVAASSDPAGAATPPREESAARGSAAPAIERPSAPPPAARDPRAAKSPDAAAARPGPPGFITIDSSPVYAEISIDGKSYGETPLVNLSLPAGRHRVRAVSPGYAPRTVYITIESDKKAPVLQIKW